MKICTCFKTVPDDGVTIGQDRLIREDHTVDIAHIRQVFNGFEESGLEMALRLSDQLTARDQRSELTALTIDGERGDLFLKQLLAVQYDRAVRIDPGKDSDLRFDPETVSQAIAAFVNQSNGFHLLILGAHGGEGENRQTGFLVAERLGWPCIRSVTALYADEVPGQIRTVSRDDGGTLEQTVSLPVVLVVGNTAEVPYLRVPTLRQKLAAASKKSAVIPIEILQIQPVLDGGKTLVDLYPKKTKKSCRFISGKNRRDTARHVYDRFFREIPKNIKEES